MGLDMEGGGVGLGPGEAASASRDDAPYMVWCFCSGSCPKGSNFSARMSSSLLLLLLFVTVAVSSPSTLARFLGTDVDEAEALVTELDERCPFLDAVAALEETVVL